jgi:hypothetical protein
MKRVDDTYVGSAVRVGAPPLFRCGHPKTADNIYLPPQQKNRPRRYAICVACKRNNYARWKARHTEQRRAIDRAAYKRRRLKKKMAEPITRDVDLRLRGFTADALVSLGHVSETRRQQIIYQTVKLAYLFGLTSLSRYPIAREEN